MTLIIVLALNVVLVPAVCMLIIANCRLRRKHKQESEELERQYQALDELMDTEAWKQNELRNWNTNWKNLCGCLTSMMVEVYIVMA